MDHRTELAGQARLDQLQADSTSLNVTRWGEQRMDCHIVMLRWLRADGKLLTTCRSLVAYRGRMKSGEIPRSTGGRPVQASPGMGLARRAFVLIRARR